MKEIPRSAYHALATCMEAFAYSYSVWLLWRFLIGENKESGCRIILSGSTKQSHFEGIESEFDLPDQTEYSLFSLPDTQQLGREMIGPLWAKWSFLCLRTTRVGEQY